MAGILQVLSTGEVDEHFVAVMHIDMLLQSCTPWCDTRKDAGHAYIVFQVSAGHD